MKAVGYYAPGAIDRPDSLVDLDLPVPAVGPRDLLVRVKAVSVNPVDTKVRSGSAPAEGEARILGWDAAGIVEGIGDQVTLFRPGDEVFYAGALQRPGTNAELHAVDERIVGHKPRSLGWDGAAALPLTTLTAWELLFDRLHVPYGRKTGGGTLLVINGAGGVGSILIQLARRLTGLTIVATASRPETIEWVRDMGAHHVIDHHRPLDQALKETGIEQAEYVASLTASDRHLPAIAELIAPQGALALIDDPAAFDINPFKRKSVRVGWEFMFTRSMFETPDMIEQHRILEEVSALVDAGVLRSTMTSSDGPINAANLKALHRLLESGSAMGKAVLAGF
ncbi:Bifunctional protein: zinc-containing alcohol dehydrogenase; quinone oxidoreductase (NADPH:quinone reductase); Similar to arginate lyase [Sphingobium indicum BiD32]|uniref:Zinc-type alcohol dehydrogenase-like protein n=1 Tax=Sphingobium indicum BiD32 TaxID=1301087 RepID=N1MMA0_9SPHN|nr:zinc-binding alcohol dehydrogenase family protein [Sphingobium indicum]CCW18330.1 Bifunctional protein: zinc-containing alcohol dehydrogenase; quinone oxidoreductase (NADPH:quinone reductase); Similar to arginate lyase [Sphingobium indicum BiD32]